MDDFERIERELTEIECEVAAIAMVIEQRERQCKHEMLRRYGTDRVIFKTNFNARRP